MRISIIYLIYENFLKKLFIKKFFLKILKPNFLENERYAWIIKNIRNLPKGSSIIDIGAGEQMFMGICEDLKYTSQDIAIYDGFGKEGLHTGTWDTSNIDIVSDATSIPVDDCSFDNALCTEVLEHAPYPVKILNEIYRILKPGGKLILTVPSLSLTHFAPYFYQSGFSKYFFSYHSKEIGFQILDIKNTGGAFDLIFSIATSIRPKIKEIKNINKFNKYILILFNYIILGLSGILRLMPVKSLAQDICPIGTFVLLKKK